MPRQANGSEADKQACRTTVEPRAAIRLVLVALLVSTGFLLGACGGLPSPSPTRSASPTLLSLTASATSTEIPSPTIESGPSPIPTATQPLIRRAQSVLIISLDGLRPDALSAERTPNMMNLAARGAYAPNAQTIQFPKTLTAHASMLSGYDVYTHGILWNEYIPSRGFIPTSTVFSIAHDHGLHTAMLVGKEKLIHIATPGTLDDYAFVPGGDEVMVVAGTDRIAHGIGVLFIHFRAPDSAGSRHGWMSEEYLEVVAEDDEYVGELLEALVATGQDETTLVIITADHGGLGFSHGSQTPENLTIPWIVAGPCVAEGVTLDDTIRVMDTAATALWALGLPMPGDLDGRPIVEAFNLVGEGICAPVPAMP
jgi:hypothetical protein